MSKLEQQLEEFADKFKRDLRSEIDKLVADVLASQVRRTDLQPSDRNTTSDTANAPTHTPKTNGKEKL